MKLAAYNQILYHIRNYLYRLKSVRLSDKTDIAAGVYLFIGKLVLFRLDIQSACSQPLLDKLGYLVRCIDIE